MAVVSCHVPEFDSRQERCSQQYTLFLSETEGKVICESKQEAEEEAALCNAARREEQGE